MTGFWNCFQLKLYLYIQLFVVIVNKKKRKILEFDLENKGHTVGGQKRKLTATVNVSKFVDT